jgi:hypothetical protein
VSEKPEIYITIDDEGNQTKEIQGEKKLLWSIDKASDGQKILSQFKPGSVWYKSENKSSIQIRTVNYNCIDEDKLPTKAFVTITAVDYPTPDGCYSTFVMDSNQLISGYKRFPACSQCGSIEVRIRREVLDISNCSSQIRQIATLPDCNQTCNDCGHEEVLVIPKTIVDDIVELYIELTIDEIEKLARKLQPIVQSKYIEACKHTELKDGRCTFCEKEFIVDLTEIKPEDKYYD